MFVAVVALGMISVANAERSMRMDRKKSRPGKGEKASGQAKPRPQAERKDTQPPKPDSADAPYERPCY